MKNIVAKNIIAITLAVVGVLSARTAGADTVTSGFYSTTTDLQQAIFSGPNFSANFTINGGVFFFIPPNNDFNSGTLHAGSFGIFSLSPSSTLQIDGGHTAVGS